MSGSGPRQPHELVVCVTAETRHGTGRCGEAADLRRVGEEELADVHAQHVYMLEPGRDDSGSKAILTARVIARKNLAGEHQRHVIIAPANHGLFGPHACGAGTLAEPGRARRTSWHNRRACCLHAAAAGRASTLRQRLWADAHPGAAVLATESFSPGPGPRCSSNERQRRSRSRPAASRRRWSNRKTRWCCSCRS